MPWCVPCDRFLSPSTVRADGTCPACGTAVDPGRAHAPEQGGDAAPAGAAPDRTPADAPLTAAAAMGAARAGIGADDDEAPPIPWHLWLLLAALAVYLGYRAFQGLELLFGA